MHCNSEITVSKKVVVPTTTTTVPRINLDRISKSSNCFKNVYDEPWIATRVKKCIEENTLETEITEPQLCVLIDDSRRFGSRYVFCISDGRTKMAFKTSSNISENLNLYYNEQMNWTGYIILINTYRLILMDANFVIDSDDYVLLEFDEDACSVINKRMKWLRWSECMPCIADLMKDKLGVEAFIPDDQRRDWRDILISNKNVVNEIESDSSDEERLMASTSKNTRALPVPFQNGKATTENSPNGDSLISIQQNSEINLPLTSTPRKNFKTNLTATELQSLNENISCIVNTIVSKAEENCKELIPPRDVNKRLPVHAIPQKDQTEATMPHHLNGICSPDQKEADPISKIIISETRTSIPNETVFSGLNSEVVLEPSRIQELREMNYIRDKRGKLYKLIIESQSEIESSCGEEEMDVDMINSSVKVQNPTETSVEMMEIDTDDEIENSQDEIVPKIQSSIQRLSGLKADTDISTQPQHLLPVVIHVDHAKQNGKKVQIGAADSSKKLSRQVLKKPWHHVAKVTVNGGKDTEELIKTIQNFKSNPNDFKQTFLKHLISIFNSDKP